MNKGLLVSCGLSTVSRLALGGASVTIFRWDARIFENLVGRNKRIVEL